MSLTTPSSSASAAAAAPPPPPPSSSAPSSLRHQHRQHRLWPLLTETMERLSGRTELPESVRINASFTPTWAALHLELLALRCAEELEMPSWSKRYSSERLRLLSLSDLPLASGLESATLRADYGQSYIN